MKSFFSFALIALVLNFAACAGPQRKPIEHAIVALDTSSCVATDILPGVPILVDHLADAATPIAERTILGMVTSIGAVSKSVACYLRAQASIKTQGESCVPPQVGRGIEPGEKLCEIGEVRAINEVKLIRNRAVCMGNCGHEQIMAKWLVLAEKQGLITPIK